MKVALVHQVAANLFAVTIRKEDVIRQHHGGPCLTVGFQTAVDVLEEV